jgi:hypothetical protein
MTTFAETVVSFSDGQSNVYALPENVMAQGFTPKQPGVRGQPLPANWLNWLFREIFRRIGKGWKDGNGSNLIRADQTDSLIIVYAIAKTDPTQFLHAMGFKSGTSAPVFKVLNNSGLTLGTVTATSIQINGAAAGTLAVRAVVTGAD